MVRDPRKRLRDTCHLAPYSTFITVSTPDFSLTLCLQRRSVLTGNLRHGSQHCTNVRSPCVHDSSSLTCRSRVVKGRVRLRSRVGNLTTPPKQTKEVLRRRFCPDPDVLYYPFADTPFYPIPTSSDPIDTTSDWELPFSFPYSQSSFLQSDVTSKVLQGRYSHPLEIRCPRVRPSGAEDLSGRKLRDDVR